MKSLKERALIAWKARVEESELELEKDLREIRTLLRDLKSRLPGTPEYVARRKLEAEVVAFTRFCNTLIRSFK